MRQTIEISDTKLQNYLSKNKLMLTFCILHYGFKALLARREILEKKLSDFRNYSLVEYPPLDNLIEEVSKRQVIHLDLLSSIFMFMEDFLGYSHNLRKSLISFPKHIASRNDKTVRDEIKYLTQLKKKDIPQYLLFPNIKLLSIDKSEKMLLNYHLQQIDNDEYKSIKNIIKFYKKYYRVYIKYKHIFTALLGFYNKRVDTKNKKIIISSQILIRDYNKRFSTYILPTTSIESVDYYQDVIDNILNIFITLIISYLNYMSNLGQPFVIPLLPPKESENSKILQNIIEKINYSSLTFIPMQTNIEFPYDLSMNLITQSRKDKIFKMRSDIFNYRQKQTKTKK